MRIKLICSECRTEFSCERGAEMKEATRCPNCNSGNVIIPMVIVNGTPIVVKEEQQPLF